MSLFARYTPISIDGGGFTSGVTSLNTLTGALTIESSTLTVTTPDSSHIEIELTAGNLTSSDITVTGGTGAVLGSGTSLSIVKGNLTDTGTDGITITGGSNAVLGSGTTISQHVADTTHNGYLSSTDWNTFNNKQAALTIGDLTDAGTDGITITGGTGAVIGTGTSISQHVADTTHNGYLSSTDWNTFNSKQSALTIGNLTSSDITVTGGTGSVIGSGTSLSIVKGNLTEATSSVLTITGGSNSVLGSGTTIQVKQASTSQSGYLSNTDWNTFNSKQAAGNYITALTGDGSASGPGSAALTLATVNSNVGSFALSTITVNAKGLVTAASAASTTGSGNVVLATSPTLVTPALGTPASGTLTNCTGLPLTSGVTGVLPIANGGTGSATTSATLVFAGPTSGGSAAPSFRSLIANDLPQRPYSSYYISTGPSVAASTTLLKYDTVISDVNNYYNPSTGSYTCPFNGVYLVFAGASTTQNIATTNAFGIQVHQTGSINRTIMMCQLNVQAAINNNYRVIGCAAVLAQAGDSISIEFTNTNGAGSLDTNTNVNQMEIVMI